MEQMTSNKKKIITPLQRFYLAEQRIKLGLTVEELSQRLNVSRFYYYQIESGRRGASLKPSIALALVKELKIDALYFLESEAEHMKKFHEINEI